MYIKYNSIGDIEYNLVRKKQKNIYLRVREGELAVSCGLRVSQKQIEEVLLDKKKWIIQALKKGVKNKELGYLYLFGDKVNIKVELGKGGVCEIRDETFFVYILHNVNVKDKVLGQIDFFYKREINKVIAPLLEKWSEIMGVQYNKVSFRKVVTRWGSCSYNNNLSFNIFLAKLPFDAIEYIVIHELAHIKHKNHSKEFWAFVEIFCPEYNVLRKKIRYFEN